MEKYYNAYDRLFLSEEFLGEFQTKCRKYSGIITGVTVWVAVICVNKYTGQPEYSINDSESNDIQEDSLYANLFDATIHAETGVLIIPNIKAIQKIEKDTGTNIAFKIVEYSIDTKDKQNSFLCEHNIVSENEFIRFIKENFEKFNNASNYHGQNTAYSYHKVEKEYPRDNYMVGYDSQGIAVCYPYRDGKHLDTFFASAKTKEEANSYLSILKNITKESFLSMIYGRNNTKVNDMLKQLAKNMDAI